MLLMFCIVHQSIIDKPIDTSLSKVQAKACKVYPILSLVYWNLLKKIGSRAVDGKRLLESNASLIQGTLT